MPTTLMVRCLDTGVTLLFLFIVVIIHNGFLALLLTAIECGEKITILFTEFIFPLHSSETVASNS